MSGPGKNAITKNALSPFKVIVIYFLNPHNSATRAELPTKVPRSFCPYGSVLTLRLRNLPLALTDAAGSIAKLEELDDAVSTLLADASKHTPLVLYAMCEISTTLSRPNSPTWIPD